MNRLEELQAYHAQCLEDYVRFWRIPEERNSVEMTVEEAAYHFVKHAGMLYRFTGDGTLFDLFASQEQSERRQLALDVCRYILKSTFLQHARRAIEPPRVGELDNLEFVLMKRDDLRVVMDTIARACQDVIVSDMDVQDAFGNAISAEAEFDDFLQERRDRVAFAARPLRDMSVDIQIPLNPRQWWFTETEQWQRDVLRRLVATLTDSRSLDDEILDASVAEERSRLVARKPDGAFDIREWLSQLHDVLFPAPRVAMAMAAQGTDMIALEVEDLVSSYDPFTVEALLNSRKNAIEVEVSDEEGGVSKLCWLEGASLIVSSRGEEERFSFDRVLGTCQIKLNHVQPAGDTRFEIRDKSGKRVCVLRLSSPT